MNRILKYISIASLSLFLNGCKEDKGFDTSKFETEVTAKFIADEQIVFKGSEVQFTNNSSNAESFEWTFEGGTPATSNEENPKVVYNLGGDFAVTLKISSGDSSDEIKRDGFVKVIADANWKNFQYPSINFVNKSVGGNGAIFKRLVPDHNKLLKQVCLEVCQLLYWSADDINQVDQFDYVVKDYDGISGKSGQQPYIKIEFSSTYLKQKQDSGMSDEDLLHEIKGVLYHELTHGYQYEPKGAGVYETGSQFWSFLEGMADYCRYKAGYFTLNQRRAGGTWTGGYRTSGFFIDWLHSKDELFIKKFNRSALTINPWSWDKATKAILGVPVQELWDEYQESL